MMGSQQRMLSTLFFIIFGRKVRDADYGPSYPHYCRRCDNDVYYHAYKWRSWGHIFWIPLIPWFSHKELVCPVCGAGIEVERDEFKDAKELIEVTQDYREHQLSDHEYVQALYEFEKSVSFIDEPIDPDQFKQDGVDAEVTEEEIDSPARGYQ